ncbi:MAG TPA: hypothetical protein V6D15_00345 [Oculatellaceae cyanobacterium]|jgi:hypothetical protein
MFVKETNPQSATHQYLSFLESLGQLIDSSKQALSQKDSQHLDEDILIFDGNERVYSKLNGVDRGKITPQLEDHLNNLKSVPIGQTVEKLGSLTVIKGGKIVLQSAENKVLNNSFLELETNLGSVVELPTTISPSPSAPTNGLEAEQHNLGNVNNGDYTQKSFISSPFQSSATTELPSEPQNLVGGFARAIDSTQQLPDGVHKALLSAQLIEMQQQMQQMVSTISSLRSQMQQLVDQQYYLGNISNFSAEHSGLSPQRITQDAGWSQKRQAKESSWLEQSAKVIEQNWRKLVQRGKNHDAAFALRALFHTHVSPDVEQVYHAENYLLERKGREYTLKDKLGAELMKFRSTPMMGITVQAVNSKMPDHYQNIEQLREQQQQDSALSGAFAPIGVHGAKYFTRVDRILNGLVQDALAKGSPIQVVDRQLGYRWMASPDGNVAIERKKAGQSIDEYDRLLTRANNKLASCLNERDLQALEQIVSAITHRKQHQVQSRSVAFGESPLTSSTASVREQSSNKPAPGVPPQKHRNGIDLER